MGKPFKDKLKNIGDFISGIIAEVEKQAKDSALENDLSRGSKLYFEGNFTYNIMVKGSKGMINDVQISFVPRIMLL